ncbi:FlgO family outer membrane protein [Arsukibacterium sp.]|uniref:FlgO family outer membrane protein n=1 Tax=Arsukibacterium sp. TaxID=1977258 RepID=UPI00299D4DC4|nr:FlgO family outer membrane protein [Arsukibacterium sp.]MDX1677663.1 FlgO family outer membrane protein [Arsukibacterium sp.]
MKRLAILTLVMGLSGCAVPENTVTVAGQSDDIDDNRTQRITTFATTAALAGNELQSAARQPLLTVNDYVRNLVHELMALQQQLDSDSQVGVTDFSYVDSALDQGSVFSNHLSEAMIYDLHKFGVPVLDYKVTDYIRVTETGDFVLSRNYEELSDEVAIRYVVTGTLTTHQQGVLVNARLVQIDNKRVVSAARTFIPRHIVQAVISRQGEQVMRIKQS